MMWATPEMLSPTAGSTAVAGCWHELAGRADADEADLGRDGLAVGIRHGLARLVEHGALGEQRGEGERLLGAVALDDDDRARSPAEARMVSVDSCPARDRGAVDADQAVAGQQAGRGARGGRVVRRAHSWLVEPAGCTQAETLPIVVLACAVPKPISRIANSTTAMSRFMNGPPNMMMMRFHTGSR